ncbi:sodium/proline symporter [Thermococcus aggregans]|uniref:Sodium/proline symporter n=1 Tax=Thermococcus aggregans TaxID=110163 RepID=A0A9E7MWF3_THEAG|nr:sodium/proline symporter [Thermococcus aggregans]USS40042.1 sodium/proline symporter [Thermococcus aggregans]
MIEEAIFIGYLILLLIVGWLGTKYTKTVEDFYVAGRKMGAWVMAFTHEASAMSGWVFLGAAGMCYAMGYTGLWNVPGVVIGTVMVFVLCAIPTWRLGKLLGAITLTDVLKARYYDDENRLSTVVSAVILLGSWLYVLAQLVASGKTLEFFFGWKYAYGVILAGLIITLYTMASGLFAVAWTDFIQGAIMLLGLTLAVIAGIKEVGGITPTFHALHSIDPSLVQLAPTMAVLAFGISFLLGEGTVSYLGQPHLYPRYLASKSPKTIARAGLIATVVIIIFMIGAALGGFAGKVLWPDPSVFPRGDPEYVLLQLFRYVYPPVIAALFTTAVLAGAMSTADSWLLVAASTVAWDIYTRILGKEVDQEKHVQLSRIVVLIIGITTILIALKPSSVLWLVAYAWGTFAQLGVIIVGGYYWKRGTQKGAIWGLIAGVVTNIVWYHTLRDLAHPAPIGMAVGSIVYIIVSLLDKEPPKKAQDLVVYARTGKLPEDSEWKQLQAS